MNFNLLASWFTKKMGAAVHRVGSRYSEYLLHITDGKFGQERRDQRPKPGFLNGIHGQSQREGSKRDLKFHSED